MRFNQKDDGTDEGVSVVIGFIMILAILMLGMTMYQQTAIPQQERAAEVNHHRQAMNQLQSFSSSFLQSADGRQTSTDIKPGLTYGSSTSVFVNSPPSSGKLSIEEFESNVLIENAEGVGKSSVFWDGEGSEEVVGNGGDNGVVYSTGYFSFSPQYYHYQNAPTTKLEYGMLYKDYRGLGPDQPIVQMNSQPVVSDKSINIVMMDGDLDVSQVPSMNVQIKPISASDQSISVTNEESNDRLRVSIPSNVPVEQWRQMLASEACENNGAGLEASLSDGDTNCDSGGGSGHVSEVLVDNSPSGDERIITIVFERGVNYDLKLSKLYITSESSTSQKPSTKPLYAAWQGSEDITIREDSAVSIDAVALDKYNNPVSGSEVVAETVNVQGGSGSYPDECYGGYGSGDTYSDSTTCNSGESSGVYYQRGWENSGPDGSVVFVYQAPEVENDVRIEFRVCLQRYLDEGGAEEGTNQQQNLDNDDVIDQCAEVDNNRNV